MLSLISNSFLTLAIESSCDDTAVALLRGPKELVTQALYSQIESHSAFGGVVPELASRMHQGVILSLVRQVLQEGGVTAPQKELGLIGVTSGPGLMGSLLVGVMTAKALAQAWGVPLLGVNHLEGHLFANALVFKELTPPFICGIFSGGHTELVLVRDFGDYLFLGGTRDDAVGEAYDKVAKLLGLGYPGGPIVDSLAHKGNPNAFTLPVPLKGTNKVEFSFSGLKTAVLSVVRALQKQDKPIPVEDVCASFQAAAVASLLDKIQLAVKQTGVTQIAISGGVAANSGLRESLEQLGKSKRWNVLIPPKSLCTDNAAMIAAAGVHAHSKGAQSTLALTADPAWDIWGATNAL